MPGLVYIGASSPFGPVTIGTAADIAGLLAVLDRTGPPAHVERVECDAVAVADRARILLAHHADGLRFSVSVKDAIRAVQDAHAAVLATTPASNPVEAAPEPPVARRDAISTDSRPASGPVVVPNAVDVRTIRVALGMSQPEFSKAFGLKLSTVRDWDQGRSKPDAIARVLLTVIQRRPDAVREALAAP